MEGPAAPGRKQACELGLGSCWIGWIRPLRVRRVVGWPGSVRPLALFTLGWPADPGAGRKTARLPLDDLATWL